MSNKKQTVLVTGGSGFVGGWIIMTLLRRGYRVRTTMRSRKREAELRAAVTGQGLDNHQLAVVEADLLADGGWDQALAGVDFVQHVASPMPVGEFKGQNLVAPARDGTLRVLQAAQRAGARRMVLTSSTVAALPQRPAGHVYDETNWTDPDAADVGEYARAKTLAEQAAWDFVASHPELALTTILPGAIQGPLLTPDLSGWADLINRMLKGKLPFLPGVGMAMVDVRDLAELHVRAMESPAAVGQRFSAAGEFVWFAEAAQFLRDELGADAGKVRVRVAPDWLIRLLALGNADLRELAPLLGQRKTVSAQKAKTLLGWEGRPLRQSIADAGRSILAITPDRTVISDTIQPLSARNAVQP